MPRKLVGYVRVSTEEQAEKGISLEAQEAMIADYCKREGVELVRIYHDPGVSGGKPLGQRPEGGDLVEALEGGEVQGIVATRLDRLFRSVSDCALRTEKWREHGVELHLLDVNVDTSTPMGEAFVGIAAVFAQLERQQARARIREAMARKRAKGERLGNIPYGKRLGTDGKTLEDDEVEQEVIQAILELHDNGLSLKSIADELNARGYPSRGRQWHVTTVARIVKRAEKEE